MKKSSSKSTITKVDTYALETVKNVKIKKMYLNNKLTDVSFVSGSGPHGSTAVLVKPEFWDVIKKISPWDTVSAINKDAFGFSGHVWQHVVINLKDINVDQELEQLATNNQIIFAYSSGHLIFDINGEPIPFVHHFDYSGTFLHTNHIDLDKAVKRLQKHRWIVNRDTLAKVDIPYYNRDNNQNEDDDNEGVYEQKYVSIQVLPDKKTYKEIYQMAIAHNKDIFSVRMKELLIGCCFEFPTYDPLKLHDLLKEASYLKQHQLNMTTTKKKK